jgi:hypothetical protein
MRGTNRAIRLAMVLCAVAVVAASSATAARLITGAQVKNSSLTGADIRNRSLTSLDFRGSVRGPAGPAGPAGAPGTAGIASIVRVDGPVVAQGGFGSGSGVQTATATCPAGAFATGGGYNSAGIDNLIEYAKSSPTSYSVIAVNFSNTATTISAHVICAAGSGLTGTLARSSSAPPEVLKRAQQLRAQLASRARAAR